jgi:hypothetical protein
MGIAQSFGEQLGQSDLEDLPKEIYNCSIMLLEGKESQISGDSLPKKFPQGTIIKLYYDDRDVRYLSVNIDGEEIKSTNQEEETGEIHENCSEFVIHMKNFDFTAEFLPPDVPDHQSMARVTITEPSNNQNIESLI